MNLKYVLPEDKIEYIAADVGEEGPGSGGMRMK